MFSLGSLCIRRFQNGMAAAYLWVSSQPPPQPTMFPACALAGHPLPQIFPRLPLAILQLKCHQPRAPSSKQMPHLDPFPHTSPSAFCSPTAALFILSICDLPPPVEWGPQDGGDLALFSAASQSLAENRRQKTFVGHIRNRDTNDSPFPHVSNGSGHATHSLALTHNHLTTCLSPRPEAELASTDPL